MDLVGLYNCFMHENQGKCCIDFEVVFGCIYCSILSVQNRTIQ
jgi:hypothetical protein